MSDRRPVPWLDEIVVQMAQQCQFRAHRTLADLDALLLGKTNLHSRFVKSVIGHSKEADSILTSTRINVVLRGSNSTQYAQNSLDGFLNGSRLNWRETKKSES
jgi:hypothetical protein